jgi:hypothetical protein
MNKEDIPLWYVKDCLNYNPETGVFTWRMTTKRTKAGEIAGTNSGANGYVRITLAGDSYRAHRLAWFYTYGEWPSVHVDHINHDRADNRIENLRLVDQQQNTQNMSKRKNSVCNFKGVTPFPRDKSRFVAQIRYDGKQRKLGVFATQEEAHEAYCAAARNHFGDYFFAG